METSASALSKKTLKEKNNRSVNNWTTVYIKEEHLSSDENQNNCSGDPLQNVNSGFDALVNDFDNDLSMHSSVIVPTLTTTGSIGDHLSGSNCELRKVMAKARATLCDGENFLPSRSGEFPTYTDDLAYDTPYDGSQYVDDKITSSYGFENPQYSNFTSAGQTSSSPDSNLSISSTDHPSASPIMYSCIGPINQFFGSQTSISSMNNENGISINPGNCTSNNPNDFALRGPSRSNLQSSDNAFSSNSEFIIPDFLNCTQQETGASVGQLEPFSQGQSTDFYSQPDVSSTTLKEELSNYYASHSMSEVYAGLNSNLSHYNGEAPSLSGRTKRLNAKKSSRILKNGQPSSVSRRKLRGSTLSPISIDDSFLPPIAYIFQRQSAQGTNTGSLPPFSHPDTSYLNMSYPHATAMSLPRSNESLSNQSLSPDANNYALFLDDSPLQTYNHLQQPNSSLLIQHPSTSTCTPDATSSAFSVDVQPTNYSSQMPCDNNSAFSPSIPSFVSLNPTTSVANTPHMIPQSSGNEEVQLVNENRMSNTFSQEGSSNRSNVSASNGRTASTSGQNNAKRTTSRAFNSSLKVQCPICFATFSSSGHLKRHSESHGAERRFRCQECDCAYSRQDNLRNHLKMAHGIEHVKARQGRTSGNVQGRRDFLPTPASHH